MKEKKPMSRQMLIRLCIVGVVLVLAVTLSLVLILTYGGKTSNKPDPKPPQTDQLDTNAFRSPSSLSVDKDGNVYVSDATANAVVKLSPKGEELAIVVLKQSVQKILVNGDSVYALVGELAGELVILDNKLTVKKTVEVGHTPSDIVVKDKVAYVANRFDNTVSVVDLEGGKVTATVDAGREPVALTLAGNNLYIANHLSSAASNADVVAATVTVMNTSNNAVKTIELVDGATGVRGITASSDGKYVFVTHLVARYEYPTTQLDRGWINSNAFSVIETKTGDAYAILLDEVELGASNPWDIAINDKGDTLYVSLSGTHEIMSVNMSKLIDYIDDEIESGEGIVKGKDDIVNHINFLSTLSGVQNRQKRYALSGNGARDIELVGDTLYVAQYFSGSIDVINFESKNEVTTSTLSVGTQPEQTSERLGEMIWYDARFCYQQWESCASCHPDARADSLNWDNLNDDLGNPKNTKSMLFSHRTPPVMITGARADAELAVVKGMNFIQFNVLGEDMLSAIDDYLRSLLPVESPYLNRDGTLTEAAERGKKLFESAGCAECHPAPLYTDLAFHTSPYLGSDGTWENRDFVTPTLVEVWRSYPWIYYGGVTDMKDIVRKFAPDLKDNEVADLAEFVLSIGIVDEKFGVEQVFGTDKEGTKLTCKVTPGATLNTVTVRNQTKGNAQEATVTITLYGADKKEIKSVKQQTGKLSYGQLAKLQLEDFKVPADIQKGSYLVITITAADGTALATDYRLNCEVK